MCPSMFLFCLFLVATPYSKLAENATEAVAADVASVEGRQKVQQRVAELCQGELGVGKWIWGLYSYIPIMRIPYLLKVG